MDSSRRGSNFIFASFICNNSAAYYCLDTEEITKKNTHVFAGMGESIKLRRIAMIIPEPIHTVSTLIDQYHEDNQEPPRPHMGASMLGHSCERWLWLNFRWVVQEHFPGRILRLFRRGHMEEVTVVSDLRAAGLDVSGLQNHVKFGSHVSGSTDGIVSGVPESPNKKHVLEVKTHSKKSFDSLVKDGVEKSKPMHFIQMQVYMLGLGLERALYYAICKDDDRIYTERVKLDKALAEKYVERGKRIALSDRMPPPLSADPSWYECKFCPAHSFCHKGETPKKFSCRTCAHATAKEDSTWRCEKHDADGIPVEFQRQGCDQGVVHPDIVPWDYTMIDYKVLWDTPWGEILNGEDAYSGSEVLANPKACATGIADEFRAVFGARVVG